MSGHGLAVVLLFALLYLAIWIGLTYWTYTDATVNSSHPPVLWAALVFTTGLFGLLFGLISVLVYVVVGRDEYDPPQH